MNVSRNVAVLTTLCVGLWAVLCWSAARPDSARAVIPGADGDPGVLAFDSDRSGRPRVYVISADGSGLRPIPSGRPHRGGDTRPAWAPPGAFTDEANVRGLFAPEQAGTSLTLFGDGFDAQQTQVVFPSTSGGIWARPTTVSTDGKELTVTVPDQADSGAVCVTKPSNNRLLQGLAIATTTNGAGILTVTDAQNEVRPTVEAPWCSQPLAFQRTRGGRSQIWLWDPASQPGTRDLIELTAGIPGSNFDPRWSPNEISSGVPFCSESDASHRPLLAFVHRSRGHDAIEVLDPSLPVTNDGRNPSRLTPSDVDDDNPDWSPEAHTLAFDSDQGGARGIWTMDVVYDLASRRYVAQNRRTLTADQLPSSEPSWYDFVLNGPPEGAIAFSGPLRRRSAQYVNYLSWRVGSQPCPPPVIGTSTFSNDPMARRPLLAGGEPAWSPYGDSLAYVSTRRRHSQLFLLHLSPGGGVIQRLTNDHANDRDPNWRAVLWDAEVYPFQVGGYTVHRGCRHRRRSRRCVRR